MTSKLNAWLTRAHPAVFSIFAGLAAFITYFAMYAFRKPLSAGIYEGLVAGPFDYKIIAITSQVVGYTISKFLGIKIVAEMTPNRRIVATLGLIGIAWLALLGFAAVPAPYNLIFLVLNGLPLGMIWGIVFSFLEGRQNTELLGTILSTSFIVSSGVVKAVGLWFVESVGVSEFWMPFLTGLVFVPALFLGAFMLKALPPPTSEDEAARTKRVPMDKAARWRFIKAFATGIVLSVVIYIALTIFRDVRDNFAVDLWRDLGYGGQPAILAITEVPVAIGVMIIIGLMIFIKNNRKAFYLNYALITLSGVLLIGTTFAFGSGLMNPVLWMIVNGFSMYLAYMCYQTFLFERWIAHFKYESNYGFLIYVADAFGYLGSVGILFVKNFGSLEVTWLTFFQQLAYYCGGVMIVLGIATAIYFLIRERTLPTDPGLEPTPSS